MTLKILSPKNVGKMAILTRSTATSQRKIVHNIDFSRNKLPFYHNIKTVKIAETGDHNIGPRLPSSFSTCST
jgi:hypothetical protein